jgi:hypothetical protein
MAKYNYKNENVLNEFIGRILKALAGKSGKKAASLLKADPEMQKLMKKGDDLTDEMRKLIQKNKKNNPEYARQMAAISRNMKSY